MNIQTITIDLDTHVVVPREPTEKMIIDGFESNPENSWDEEIAENFRQMSGCQGAAYRARLCYEAMLNIAPAFTQSSNIPMQNSIDEETIKAMTRGAEILNSDAQQLKDNYCHIGRWSTNEAKHEFKELKQIAQILLNSIQKISDQIENKLIMVSEEKVIS